LSRDAISIRRTQARRQPSAVPRASVPPADLDLEHCPQCGGELKIIAAIEEPAVIVRILTHLGLPARAPIVHVIAGKHIPRRETGAVDHLALKATGDINAALAKITAHGVEYTMRKLERTGVTQVFFRDPDGVGVELKFAP